MCPAHEHLMAHLTKRRGPLHLDTAGGDLNLDPVGDLICGGVVCRVCDFAQRDSLQRSQRRKRVDASMRVSRGSWHVTRPK